MVKDHLRKESRLRESKWIPARRYLRSAASAVLWDWLLDATSLTRRLKLACDQHFSVQVLQQGWGRPLPSESRALGIKRGGRTMIREVRLMCGTMPLVFARTVIPVSTLRGRLRRLGYLGSRPLGAALFADPHLRRGEVEVTRVVPGEILYGHAAASIPATDGVWGRRSVFWLHGKALLVSEFFLPALVRHDSQWSR